MKATVELPDSLFREIKLKSVLEGRKLKDTVTHLLRAGLAAESTSPLRGGSRKKPKLPVIECRHTATPETEMTPDRVARILHEQEISQHAKPRR